MGSVWQRTPCSWVPRVVGGEKQMLRQVPGWEFLFPTYGRIHDFDLEESGSLPWHIYYKGGLWGGQGCSLETLISPDHWEWRTAVCWRIWKQTFLSGGKANVSELSFALISLGLLNKCPTKLLGLNTIFCIMLINSNDALYLQSIKSF